MIVSGIYPIPLCYGILLYLHLLRRYISPMSLVLCSGRAMEMRSTQPLTEISTKMPSG
jgi:hypothetical protein